MALLALLLPISNEFLFHLCTITLVLVVVLDVLRRNVKKERVEEAENEQINYRTIVLQPILLPPIHSGSLSRNSCHMDIISMNKYVPLNVKRKSLRSFETALKYPVRRSSEHKVVRRQRSSITGTGAAGAGSHSGPNNSRSSNSVNRVGASSGDKTTKESTEKNQKKANALPEPKLPYLPGCEADGHAAKTLQALFPDLPRADIVRFLVARKGDVKLAEEMLRKSLQWRAANFPLKRSEDAGAFNSLCFFPYGRAKDGSPVVIFRGGMYDSTKATPEQYVLASAYTIDWSIAQCPDQIGVTVVVHTASVPGGPNESADTNFIKLFSQALSDNYPERLKRLAIFPFPWYGRAIWSVAKMFVDKRTQEKVLLIPSSGKGIPSEVLEFIDAEQLPICCLGKNKAPIPNLLDTIE